MMRCWKSRSRCEWRGRTLAFANAPVPLTLMTYLVHQRFLYVTLKLPDCKYLVDPVLELSNHIYGGVTSYADANIADALGGYYRTSSEQTPLPVYCPKKVFSVTRLCYIASIYPCQLTTYVRQHP